MSKESYVIIIPWHGTKKGQVLDGPIHPALRANVRRVGEDSDELTVALAPETQDGPAAPTAPENTDIAAQIKARLKELDISFEEDEDVQTLAGKLPVEDLQFIMGE